MNFEQVGANSRFQKCTQCGQKPASIRYIDFRGIQSIVRKLCYLCDKNFRTQIGHNFDNIKREIIPYNEMFKEQYNNEYPLSQKASSNQILSQSVVSPQFNKGYHYSDTKKNFHQSSITNYESPNRNRNFSPNPNRPLSISSSYVQPKNIAPYSNNQSTAQQLLEDEEKKKREFRKQEIKQRIMELEKKITLPQKFNQNTNTISASDYSYNERQDHNLTQSVTNLINSQQNIASQQPKNTVSSQNQSQNSQQMQQQLKQQQQDQQTHQQMMESELIKKVMNEYFQRNEAEVQKEWKEKFQQQQQSQSQQQQQSIQKHQQKQYQQSQSQQEQLDNDEREEEDEEEGEDQQQQEENEENEENIQNNENDNESEENNTQQSQDDTSNTDLRIAQNKELIEKLKAALQDGEQEVQTEYEKMRDVFKEERKKFKETIDDVTKLCKVEENKGEVLMQKCQEYKQLFDVQSKKLQQTLGELQQDYGTKLTDYEKKLKEQQKKIELFQTQNNEEIDEDPLIKALESDPNLLQEMRQAVEQKNEILQKLQENFQQSKKEMGEKFDDVEQQLQEKEEIIQEYDKNNQLKDVQIEKMEQLVGKFKSLSEQLQLEKESLKTENQQMLDQMIEMKNFLSVLSSGINKASSEKENGEAEEK